MTTSNAPFLEFEHVAKTFRSRKRGDVTAIADVTMSVAGGEFVCVLGASGCGKSTLLSIGAGLTPYDAGAVRMQGSPVTCPQTSVGIVFQDATLLEWRNVRQNIMLQVEVRKFSRQKYEARVSQLIDMVGLSGFENRHPYELSGGMQQRVAICRALVHDPPMLMMDEPFGALDALTRETMTSELERIWQESQKAVLFITHSIPEAVTLADKVVVLSRSPSSVQETIHIDLPRPREPGTPEFGGYTRQIRELFTEQGVIGGSRRASGALARVPPP